LLPTIPDLGIGGFAFGIYGLIAIMVLAILTAVFTAGRVRAFSIFTLVFAIGSLAWFYYALDRAFNDISF